MCGGPALLTSSGFVRIRCSSTSPRFRDKNQTEKSQSATLAGTIISPRVRNGVESARRHPALRFRCSPGPRGDTTGGSGMQWAPLKSIGSDSNKGARIRNKERGAEYSGKRG